MSKKIIGIFNKKTGQVSVKTEGYSGDECMGATQDLEDKLGLDRACAVPTAEMHVQQPTEDQNTVGGA